MDEERGFEMVWEQALADVEELADRYADFYHRLRCRMIDPEIAGEMTAMLISAEQTRFPEIPPQIENLN